MEIKNKLAVTKGEGGGGQWGWERRGRVKSRNKYKGLMDKDNAGEDCMWEQGWAEKGRVMGGNGNNCNCNCKH